MLGNLLYICYSFYLKKLFMKKLALLSVLSIAFCSVFTSCKSHEKCPAYSKANTTISAKKSV